MQANSRTVNSNQQYLHPKLTQVIRRHLQTTHRGEIAAHNFQAYGHVSAELNARPRPIILDSFCGTGHSTAILAERHPDHLIVGIDKSARRLAKHPYSLRTNYLLLQADCAAIWTLLLRDGLRPRHHYMLYPNPWPKAAHLQRRIHGHPSFPLLLALGGMVELRSNWQIYIEEFGCAMHLAGHRGRVLRVADTGPDLSLFEQKYRNSGHQLWCYVANIISE